MCISVNLLEEEFILPRETDPYEWVESSQKCKKCGQFLLIHEEGGEVFCRNKCTWDFNEN